MSEQTVDETAILESLDRCQCGGEMALRRYIAGRYAWRLLECSLCDRSVDFDKLMKTLRERREP